MLARSDFLIREDITFLNHGSFGACPKPVFERYQALQRELERQPITFLLRDRVERMAVARECIADHFRAGAGDIVFVTNATSGLNIVLRSLPFDTGDEILTTTHEYGAVMRLLEFVSAKTGARVVPHQIRLPYESDETFVEAFLAQCTARTKAIVISHITSPSALILPVARICRRARERGIITIIDGAHAPGQVDVDLSAIGADYYSGNFHKWLCAPKGAGFLHVRPEHQAGIEPLVISHGWREGADFAERNEWGGTRDISPWLAVPAAIEFQRAHDWARVRERCHHLAAEAQSRLCERYGLSPLSRDNFAQMVTIPLPEFDAEQARARIYDEYRIEIPLGRMLGRCGTRLSVAVYNSREDIERLLAALAELIG